MKKARIVSVLALSLFSVTGMLAQRTMDKLDRGLVAVPANSGGGNLVSWRIFGEEYYDTYYNLYRNGVKLNETPLSVSNFTDTSGSSSSTYQVAAVVRGVEQEKCAAVQSWGRQYWEIPVAVPTDREGNDASAYYTLNDVTLADLNGDGVSEFIVKRPCSSAADPAQNIRFHQLDCYDLNGNRLWWIDLGPNMLAGADEQWDAVAYDWDGDGKAEVLMRGQDNMIIHYADGTTLTIGDNTVDTRWAGIEYTSSGNEYLLYLEGATGKPYQIGPSAHPDYMDYPLTRGNTLDWEPEKPGIVGHRSTKHFFGAPFLDGRHASIFLGRGIYTKHKMAAFDVDPVTHLLTQRWTWNCEVGGPWFGQGYHNYAIADVDWDGRDEIVYGSMVIDDNGKGLSTTGLGHGDAQHCSDLDPYRHGQEQFACNEDKPAMNYRNATTSQLYYRATATGDDGRSMCANFTNAYPGSVGRSVTTGWVSSVADKIVSELGGDALVDWNDLNWRIYWDGDLCDEFMDSPGTERAAVVYKPGTKARILSADGTKLNNSSKNQPGAAGDLFGDWREELVLRNDANTALRIYTTNYATSYGIYTLWHDHQYRNAMVWQSLGYNQPPHKSYFLGEMEGITVAPPPLTMTGREEVPNGGTITNEDKHFIVCETGNTTVSIADGASPYIVTFNVPTWVQGTAASNCTTVGTAINTEVYTCNVTGGALTGSTRVVKQGDGVLNLPKVDMTYTGETNIWAGTLQFDGSMKNSPLWLNRFAELNSNGGEFMSIRAEYGSVIRPGGEGTQGTIAVDGDLDLRFGSRVVMDLDGESFTGDKITAKTLKIERKTASAWTKYGPAYLQPVLEIRSTNLAAGEYVIGEVEVVEGALANIRVEGTGEFKAGLSHVDGKIILTLGNTRGANNVLWTGASGAVWDFAKTENFVVADDETATPDIFVGGDVVTFNDNARQFAVTLDGDIVAGAVIVDNNERNYTFSGTGAIVDGSLSKSGNGTLTISTDNTYTGGNHLSGGVVSVSSLSNELTAYGNLGAMTTTPTKFTMENGAVLNTTALVNNGSPIRFDGDGGGIIRNVADFNQQATFSGTTLRKEGTGWLKTTRSGASLDRLVIAEGTVENSSGIAARTVEFQGGALNDNVGTNNTLYVGEGQTGTWTTASNQTYANTIAGEGTITVYGNLQDGRTWYATRTPLQFNLSGFTGTLIPQTVYAKASRPDGRFTLDTSTGMPHGTMNIPAEIEVQNTGKSFAIGKLAGTGALGGGCAFRNGVTVGANTWVVGCDEDFSWAGKITGNGTAFTKVGAGKMTVSGAWDNTGNVTVNAGELHLGLAASLGSGVLTVASGAVLSGRTSSELTNSSMSVRGTYHVGSSASAVTGTMNFGGKTVSFAAGSVLEIGVRRAATDLNSGCTSMENIGNFTMNGTISLYYHSSFAPEVGDSIVLWVAKKCTGTPVLENNVIDAEKGLYWDTTDLLQGILRVTDVNPDALHAIAADSEVTVQVVSTSGVVAHTYTCRYGEVEHLFRQSSVVGGVYLLRVDDGRRQEVRKVSK